MIIQTHDGKFHADEVASMGLLSAYFSDKNIEFSILRSRDTEKFKTSDILIDVGLEYNHEEKRYDHHQSSFKEIWSEEFGVPLSSVGLIWRHYGKEIVEIYLNVNSYHYGHSRNYDDGTIEEIWNIIYKNLILEIDANDNGVVLTKNSNNLNIPSIVGSANGDTSDDVEQNEKFSTAVDLIGKIFDIKFKEIINTYFDLQKDYEIISKMDLTGPILIISKNVKSIYKCINKLDPDSNVKFFIFTDDEKSEYTVKTRQIRGEKFISLCPISPEKILKENILKPEEIIFVHKALFIAKSSSLETAKEIANFSLENAPKNNLFTDSDEENDIEEKKSGFENKKIYGMMGLVGILGLGIYCLKKN
jgi:MYG1 exonuclease